MNEPKLRFKNDNGKQFPDWEEKRVADVANRVKVGFVGACERYYTGKNGIPLYRTGNLQLGKLIEDDMKYVSKEFHIANKKSQLHKGDILVARHGSSGNAVLYNSEKEANCLNIVIIQPNLKTVNPKFMVESINSPNVVKQVSRLKNGSTQVVLNTKDIENLDVNIPSLSEQQKIALLFSELDTLIQSAEKELEGYRELKQGMLQKMFPKKGEKVPEIRFPEFTGDWKQRKLPEFVSFFNGLTYTPDDVQETGTLVLRSSNVKNGEIVDADNVYVNDKVVTSDNVQEGDIIVVVRNGSRALIGKHAQIKASMPNTVIGAFMSGIRSEHSSFVNALLDTSTFENEIAKNIGATINQITGYMFSEMEFMIPTEKEQDKIGTYFSSLDNLIESQQRELDGYKELKKGLLQQMLC